jgi:hypothetical protein
MRGVHGSANNLRYSRLLIAMDVLRAETCILLVRDKRVVGEELCTAL